MQINTRDLILEGMIMYRVQVSAAREPSIEKLVARGIPHKHHYSDNEFFMWALDVKNGEKMETISLTDMGIDQIPQYNLHATFSTFEEASRYEDSVRIDYESLDENTIEFGGDVYVLDDSIDPNEMVPFTFDDCVAALAEMNLDWVMEVSDADEDNLADTEVYSKMESESSYERAMKGI